VTGLFQYAMMRYRAQYKTAF